MTRKKQQRSNKNYDGTDKEHEKKYIETCMYVAHPIAKGLVNRLLQKRFGMYVHHTSAQLLETHVHHLHWTHYNTFVHRVT